MPPALDRPRLFPKVFILAGDIIALDRCEFSCIAVKKAANRVRRLCQFMSPERAFYEDLFGICSIWTFCQTCESPKEAVQVRLMALALAHTLAVEQNAGRRVL